MAATSEPLSKLRAIAASYKSLLRPDKAAVGQLLDIRWGKALLALDMQNQALTGQVKKNEEVIMGLQQQSISVEKAVTDKVKVEKAKAEKAMWASKERAAKKRKLGVVDDEDEDADADDEDEFQHGRGNGLRGDDEMLTNIFDEVKWLVKENPRCKSSRFRFSARLPLD